MVSNIYISNPLGRFKRFVRKIDKTIQSFPRSINKSKKAFFPKLNKSSGYDEISFNVMERCFLVLHEPFQYFFDI